MNIEIRQQADGHREVLDPVRRRWVALTPEEEVRQQTIHLLHLNYGYPLELMQVEGKISVNGMTRRCDIVLYGTDAQPTMIVECKKPDIANGRQMVIVAADLTSGTLTQLGDIPRYVKKS